jgi:hypothetical protein
MASSGKDRMGRAEWKCILMSCGQEPTCLLSIFDHSEDAIRSKTIYPSATEAQVNDLILNTDCFKDYS